MSSCFCVAARDSKLAFGRKVAFLLRLTRFEPALLKAAFPSLFRGFRQNEISDMMTMLSTNSE